MLFYLLALSVFIGLFHIDAMTFGMYVFAYLLIGFLLNRKVLRRMVTWHPVYDSVGNVAEAKFTMFLMWPLTYFMLFVYFAINEYL
jgi:hypothetical protein